MSFELDDRVPKNHLLRRINIFVTSALADVHEQLDPYYSEIGRPSVDPELMIRMLIVGYCYGLRWERRLTQEVELHLAYRWFCRLDLDDKVPHHSTFSRDAANDDAGDGPESKPSHRYERQPPKVISPSDPQSASTAKANKRVQFGYGLNYLIDIENAVIVDVEATPARTYDEVAATQTMLDRTEERFNLKPKRLAADTAYGTGKFLGWLVKEKKIIPHIPVWEKGDRQDGILSRSDFRWDSKRGVYVCPNGKLLRTSGTVHDGRTLLYRASKRDCDACPLRAKCCTNADARKIPRDLHEDARDVARRKMKTKAFARSRDERKRVEMRFAHLKIHHGFERMRLRGLSGARDEFHLAAIVQNLKTLALRILGPPKKRTRALAASAA